MQLQLQFEQLFVLLQLQPQPQFDVLPFKFPFVPLLNKRTNSTSHQLLLQVLLFKNKMIKKKISKDELSNVFPEKQSFVKQLLHSIKEPPFNF